MKKVINHLKRYISGTMVVVKESQTRDPGWSIDEALTSVLSGGIIGPEELR